MNNRRMVRTRRTRQRQRLTENSTSLSTVAVSLFGLITVLAIGIVFVLAGGQNRGLGDTSGWGTGD